MGLGSSDYSTCSGDPNCNISERLQHLFMFKQIELMQVMEVTEELKIELWYKS
jgi:hypothetical protein